MTPSFSRRGGPGSGTSVFASSGRGAGVSTVVAAVDFGATSVRVARVDIDAVPITVDVVHRYRHEPVPDGPGGCAGTGTGSWPRPNVGSRRQWRGAPCLHRRGHLGGRLRPDRSRRRTAQPAPLLPIQPHGRLPRAGRRASARTASTPSPVSSCSPSTRSSSWRPTTPTSWPEPTSCCSCRTCSCTTSPEPATPSAPRPAPPRSSTWSRASGPTSCSTPVDLRRRLLPELTDAGCSLPERGETSRCTSSGATTRRRPWRRSRRPTPLLGRSWPRAPGCWSVASSRSRTRPPSGAAPTSPTSGGSTAASASSRTSPGSGSSRSAGGRGGDRNRRASWRRRPRSSAVTGRFDATDSRFLAPADMEAEVRDAGEIDPAAGRDVVVRAIIASVAATAARGGGRRPPRDR